MEYETFETKVNAACSYCSEPGSPTLDVYQYEVGKDGIKRLVKTDKKENVYERIQADYDSTDINKLMLRFSLGDSSAINQRDVWYGDVTEMPKTYAELFDRVEECKRTFEALPTDLKEMFSNSYEVFFTELNSDEKGVSDKFDAYNKRFEVSSESSPEMFKEGDVTNE